MENVNCKYLINETDSPETKAYKRARQHAYSDYCEKNGALVPISDIAFNPILIKIEGYKGWQVRRTNLIYCFDNEKTYPLQEFEIVYRFKRWF